MARTKTSKAWMREHVNDPWVQKAKAEGWRSRAAFKLMEIDDKDKLIRRGGIIVDLGCTPGGWSQVARKRLGATGRVIGLDLLPLDPLLPGVEFLQGDFHEETVLSQVEDMLDGAKVDLVLSDMAPNMSGIPMSDQARSIHLAELALDFAAHHLQPQGTFLVKVFQGSGFAEYVVAMRQVFRKVVTRKPDASRGRSSELYLLGQGLKNPG
jgi:23S rRNA (uridine2552-2'-O)-methyltransferase